VAGFREFPKNVDVGRFVFTDVDASPVINGYSMAACAFSVGAARAMGRFDHASVLAAQAIVSSWPLPNGTLLGPRVLSNLSNAPYLGEAAMLFVLIRRPVGQVVVTEHGKLPWFVYAGVLFLFILGTYETVSTIRKLWRWTKRRDNFYVSAPGMQMLLWLILMVTAVLIWTLFSAPFGLIILLIAQLVPFQLRKHFVITGDARKKGK
jgi:hypothetical protein